MSVDAQPVQSKPEIDQVASQPRTLIVCRSQPGSGNVGEVLIRDMLTCLAAEDFFLSSNSPNLNPEQCTEFGIAGSQAHPAVNQHSAFANGLLAKAKQWIVRRTHYDREVKEIAHKTIDYIKANKIDRCWFILDSVATVDIAYQIAQASAKPFLVQVWDDIQHLAIQCRLDRLSRKRSVRRVRELLKKAERVG